MSGRITAGEAITRANAAGRAAFVGYLPLGYPDFTTSVEAAIALAESGADIIELGPPYSDPVMDGPVIQNATQIALRNGFRTRDIFTAVAEITRRSSAAVVVMTYWNLVLQYGVEAFARDLKAAGGAGLITPDITPDSADEWIQASGDLDRIFLAAPTSSDERLDLIHKSSRGFVYAVSTLGITGTRESLDQAAKELVTRLKKHGEQPVCVGIGISNAEQVRDVAQYADGVIVGSALVRALGAGGVSQLSRLAAELAEATKR